MNDTKDEIVDRILRGMRDVEPPPGMENRIVSALRHRASAMTVPSRSLWKTVPLTGGAVLAGVVCALFLTTHRKTLRVAVSPKPSISAQARNGPGAVTAVAKRNPSKPGKRPMRIKATLPLNEDSVATSYPAPPMPLTEQEKLLLQLAHKGDPVQLAMLDPVLRAAQYDDERAQVQRFFAPPKQEITHEP